MTPTNKALRISGVLALVFLAFQAFAPASANVGSYTMALQTNAASYTGSQSIMISGTVSPAPGPNTAVIITVTNPNHAGIDYQDDAVNPTTGGFSGVTVAGGPITCAGNPCWIAGTYSVNATWGGSGSTVSQVVTFTYTPASTTTTTSTTGTVTSTSSTTTSTSTPFITTSTSTSTVPEFPSASLAVVALIGFALVALLSRRVALGPAGWTGRAAS